MLFAYAARFDEAAFGELYRRHNGALIRHLRRRFRLSADAIGELTQAVWLAVARRRRALLSARASLRGVLTIAAASAARLAVRMLGLGRDFPDFYERLTAYAANALRVRPQRQLTFAFVAGGAPWI